MYLTMALYLAIQAHSAAQEEQRLGLINTQEIEERSQMLLMDEDFLAAIKTDECPWDIPLDLHKRIEIGYEPNARDIDRLVAFYLSMREVIS
jgi:hypothetical protein